MPNMNVKSITMRAIRRKSRRFSSDIFHLLFNIIAFHQGMCSHRIYDGGHFGDLGYSMLAASLDAFDDREGDTWIGEDVHNAES
jgi:hypothetical protein